MTIEIRVTKDNIEPLMELDWFRAAMVAHAESLGYTVIPPEGERA